MPGLVLKNVSKTYQNGRKVIRDFQMEVRKGEFVILAGPEGCGKTTLLRMIAGLEDITSGTLMIDDRDMTDADPKERNLAMLFQNSILYPGMNVRDNLLFALQMQRLPQNEIEVRLEKTTGLLALAPILSSMPDSLSPAETYRALLGRALMRWPETLLLDRTTAGMGQALVGDILKGLRKIHEKTGITVIYATDREEAVRMPGTRLVVMNEGTICQDGESQEVYENPCCRFVARFVGRPSMNMMAAAVETEDGTVKLTFPGGFLKVPEKTGKLLCEHGYQGKEVILGIRPDWMKPVSGEESADGFLDGEFLGAEECCGHKYLKFQTGENEFFALWDGEKPVSEEEGAPVRLSLNGAGIHLFDLETELAIGMKMAGEAAV